MSYKATPITYKAKSGPLRADQALIDGAADLGDSKSFKNYGEEVEDKFTGEGQESKVADYSKDKESKTNQADNAVEVDSTKTPKV
jgi:hypothetical protein